MTRSFDLFEEDESLSTIKFKTEAANQYWNWLLKDMYSTRLHEDHQYLLNEWAELPEETHGMIISEFRNVLNMYNSHNRSYFYLLKFGVYRADKSIHLEQKVEALKQLEEDCDCVDDRNGQVRLNLIYLYAVLVGNAYADRKYYKMSLKCYKKATRLEKHYADAYFNRGIVYTEMGKFKKALKDYNLAIQINPSDPKLYNNRGYILHSRKRYQEAIYDFSKAIELNPSNARAYNNRGVTFAALKNFSKAIQDYNTALELDENFANAYNNRANALTYSNQIEEAMEDYSKAMESDPNNTTAVRNRALIFKRNNKLQKSSKSKKLGDFLQSGMRSKSLSYLKV